MALPGAAPPGRSYQRTAAAHRHHHRLPALRVLLHPPGRGRATHSPVLGLTSRLARACEPRTSIALGSTPGAPNAGVKSPRASPSCPAASTRFSEGPLCTAHLQPQRAAAHALGPGSMRRLVVRGGLLSGEHKLSNTSVRPAAGGHASCAAAETSPRRARAAASVLRFARRIRCTRGYIERGDASACGGACAAIWSAV